MFTYGRHAGYMTIALLVLAIAPLIAAAIFVPQMADSVALRFNSAGEATRWGSRYETLYAPVICFMVAGAIFANARRQAKSTAERTPAAARFTYERGIRSGLVVTVVMDIVSAYMMFEALSGFGFAFFA